MKIVVAPDSFKGCLSSVAVCQAIAAGIKEVLPNAIVDIVPMADGGEGTVDALVAATGGRKMSVMVTGPLGQPVEAFFGILGGGETAVIEMAAAAGLHLVPVSQRDPTKTTTYGVGELIRAALEYGCRRLIVGVGGSATNDGGAGMAQALGVRLLDADGKDLPFGGGALCRLQRIDLSGRDRRIATADVIVACDVTNPLTGPAGASAVYGPQKGATAEQVAFLDSCLRHYAQVIRSHLGTDVEKVPGAGAAGGLAAGLMAFCGARLQRGVELIIQTLGLEKRIQDADLVITGEGKLDHQTGFGKVPYGVAQVARKYHKPVVVIAGQVEIGHKVFSSWGVTACFSILNRIMSEEEAFKEAPQLLQETAVQVASIWKAASLFAPDHKDQNNESTGTAEKG
ncbi:MAG: glycerate kinase [Armatimonadetes bacterium]|nr:glycerate kinase [Armatimonadota bacterium]MDW8121073.1 glycerate kinase [Armatimonadota bacterium]